MERTDLKNKDVILHVEMSIEERNAELERIKKESEAVTDWEEKMSQPMKPRKLSKKEIEELRKQGRI